MDRSALRATGGTVCTWQVRGVQLTYATGVLLLKDFDNVKKKSMFKLLYCPVNIIFFVISVFLPLFLTKAHLAPLARSGLSVLPVAPGTLVTHLRI